jgi:hypothetical protein
MPFDPDAYLGGVQEKEKVKTSSFDPESYISGTAGAPTAESSIINKEIGLADAVAPVVQTALPAITPTGPTGVGALIDDLRGAQVFKPLTENITGRIGQYVAKPGKAILDAATMIGTGMPIAPAAMYDTYKSVQEALPRMKQALGSITDINPQMLSSLTDKLKPADISKLSELVSSSGGKAALTNFQLPAYLANDAEAVAAFNALKQQAQSAPSMFSRVAGPLVRGAAKIAGPVGLGMNIYDASQYAQESELGPRLAQGQGRMAQQAFRNMAANQQYGGLTPEQQQILEQDKIDQAIRRKAAERVLGPMVPGR